MTASTVSVSKEDFLAYEKVRVGGLTNMLMLSTVEELSGLDRAVIKEIIINYVQYAKKYLPKRYKELTRKRG